MKAEIFVDTGAWLAVLNTRDSLHEAAAKFYARALRDYGLLITTNLVVAETFALVRRRRGLSTALSLLDAIDSSSRILKVCSDEAVERDAREWLLRYEDQDFSLVDAISFAVMQSRGIDEAFAFDRHFQVAGFVRRP